jgi:hypothetical protein
MIIVQQFFKIQQPLCRDHGVEASKKYLGKTLLEGWHPDPLARHQMRYYDGTSWTEHVSNNGVTAADPTG